MSLTRRIFFGAAANWFSRGVMIFLGLVLMPVLFRTLPKEELGIWMLLGQSWATMGLLDLGFRGTLTRRVAFAKGRSGSRPDAELMQETRVEIADLVTTGLRIYRVLACLAFAVAFGLGFLYLDSLELHSVSMNSIWTAWGILCLSQAILVFATPWTCLLQGVGYIGWDAILATLVTGLTLLGQIIAALCGTGLIGLAVVAAAGALLQRIVIFAFAHRKRPDLFEIKGRWQPAVFRSMIPLAGRAWITALGASLILYTDQFVIASLQGATELPAYRAAWVLIHNFTIVAVALGGASSVFVSHLWQDSNIQEIHRVLDRNLRVSWLVMLHCVAVMYFAGESLFAVWLGPGNFIGYGVLVAFLVTEALEAQSYVISCASRATEDEAFAWSSLGAGLLKVVLSIILVRQFGLLGVALGTLIALLITNHWYVPYRGLKRLNYSLASMLRHVLLPCVAWFALLSLVLALITPLVSQSNDFVRLAIVGSIALIALIGGCWSMVLEADQKRRFQSYLRGASRAV